MKKIILLLFALTVLYSCSSVQIYSDGELKNKTGLKYYPVKPYLLVELKSEKDNTIKTTIVYLPDMANPQFLRITPGIGSNELKMTFTNGSLASYGLASESHIPETINSMASLISKSSDAFKQFAGPESTLKQEPGEVNFILYEIIITREGTMLREVGIQ
jgi:hypothetical protein